MWPSKDPFEAQKFSIFDGQFKRKIKDTQNKQKQNGRRQNIQIYEGNTKQNKKQKKIEQQISLKQENTIKMENNVEDFIQVSVAKDFKSQNMTSYIYIRKLLQWLFCQSSNPMMLILDKDGNLFEKEIKQNQEYFLNKFYNRKEDGQRNSQIAILKNCNLDFNLEENNYWNYIFCSQLIPQQPEILRRNKDLRDLIMKSQNQNLQDENRQEKQEKDQNKNGIMEQDDQDNDLIFMKAKNKLTREEKQKLWDQIWEYLILSETELEENGYMMQNSQNLKDQKINYKFFRNSNESKLQFDQVERKNQILTMDNEMVRTKEGLELARITIINLDGEIMLDSLVKPKNEIYDYNTKYSGITMELLKEVKIDLKYVQEQVLMIINDKTILIGHSLENDLNALQLIHKRVIDTSVLFKQNDRKISLKNLAYRHLDKKIIQQKNHDSKEDAETTLALAKVVIDTVLNPDKYGKSFTFEQSLDVLQNMQQNQNHTLILDSFNKVQPVSKYGIHYEESIDQMESNYYYNKLNLLLKWVKKDPKSQTVPKFLATRIYQNINLKDLREIDQLISQIYENSQKNTLFCVSFETKKEQNIPAWQQHNPFMLLFSKL